MRLSTVVLAGFVFAALAVPVAAAKPAATAPINITATAEQKFSPDHIVLHVGKPQTLRFTWPVASTASRPKISDPGDDDHARHAGLGGRYAEKGRYVRDSVLDRVRTGARRHGAHRRSEALMKALRWLAGATLCALLLIAWRTPSLAMPNFAQAYGVPCSTCHTAVPTLNAYGRYVQRSQYAFMDPLVLKKAVPVWIDYQAAYDSQAGAPDTHRVIWGNVGVHLDGLAGDNWSYHVQQWLVNDNQAGGLDTAWVSFNNLFKHNGYLEVGKLEVPAPSPFSQWLEISPFATPEVTVGEHTYELDANRWGAKWAICNGSVSLDAAYVGSDADLNGATDYVPRGGKTLQYRAAFMRPKNPLEFGVYGASGTFPTSDGLTDRFSAFAGYLQRDPTQRRSRACSSSTRRRTTAIRWQGPRVRRTGATIRSTSTSPSSRTASSSVSGAR